MKRKIAMLSTFLLVLASAAGATNLGVQGGLMSPLGDFADEAKSSTYVGAHWEIRDINARGQSALLSYLVQGGFAFLQTDDSFQDVLDLAGESGSGRYFDVGLGVRVYSSSVPLFVTVGMSYVNYNPAGRTSGLNGIGGTVGIGIEKSAESFKFGVEARVGLAVLEDDVNLQHFLLLATLGFPF